MYNDIYTRGVDRVKTLGDKEISSILMASCPLLCGQFIVGAFFALWYGTVDPDDNSSST